MAVRRRRNWMISAHACTLRGPSSPSVPARYQACRYPTGSTGAGRSAWLSNVLDHLPLLPHPEHGHRHGHYMGGDDFVQEPFDLRNSRRQSQRAAPPQLYVPGRSLQLRHRGFSSISSNSSADTKAGRPSFRVTNPSASASVPAQRSGRPRPATIRRRRLWYDEQFIDDNTLTVNVNRLRRKIAELGLDAFIATRKGMGYIVE